MLTGENSILNRATQAKTNTGLSQIDEKIKLANAAAIARGQGTLDYDILKEELAKVLGTEGEDWTISAKETNPWVVTVDGKEYPLSARGTTGGQQGGSSEDEVTELSIELTRTHQDVDPTDGGNVGVLKSFEEQVGNKKITIKVPIPTDFYYVGGDRNTGIVISDNSADENKGTTATLVGNQFVWVPVEQNQKLSLVVKSPEDITSIKLIDPSGAEMNLGISGSIGKTFSNTTITPTYNGVYKAEVTVGTEKTTETLLVRSLYAQDAFNDYFTDEFYEGDGAFNIWKARFGNPPETQMYSIISSVFGATVTNRAEFNVWAKSYDNPSSWTDPTTNSTTNLNYATSVNTNGGFYIARFEAGSSSKRTSGNASTAVSSMAAPLSKIGVDTYNYVTRDQAIGLAEKMYTGKSYLITNSAWDRTLGWIINSNDKSLALQNVVDDSKSWGNYSDSSFTATGTGSLAQTGAFGNNTKVNNIYDLAGNVFEWTSATSPDSSVPCVNRGGYYGDTGSNFPASFRGYSVTSGCYAYSGFRVALFL